ncbi:MAG: hypothetical protein WC556_13700 [Candidatus Methanoperedens sp.]
MGITDNPVLIGVLAALATNILFFDHQFYKEKQRDFIKKQIVELLLPLFHKMKSIENQRQLQRNFMGYDDALDEIQYYLTISENDKYIGEIATKNLYLAPSKLSTLILNYINYQDRNASGAFEHVDKHIVVNNFKELQSEVFKEYEQKVKEYHTLKLWWQFWK